MRVLVVDKGTLCNSLYHYPVNMVFFTTPELLEIGDLPLVCPGEKPTRNEALKYYRKGAEHYELELRLGEARRARRRRRRQFHGPHAALENGHESAQQYSARSSIIATGYYDLPNRLGVPGEDLPHVSHYYTEPHAYWRQDVVVIGGKNSAAEAALDLYRAGANVTLVHRRAELGSTIKYWVRPDIENRIKAESGHSPLRDACPALRARQRASPRRRPGEEPLAARRASLCLDRLSSRFHVPAQPGHESGPGDQQARARSARRCESNVPGIYLAGVVIGGNHTSEIFIENGRFHGKQIVAALTGAPLPVAPP